MRARSIRKEAPARRRVATISSEALLVLAVAVISLAGVPAVSAAPLALTLDEAIGIALGESRVIAIADVHEEAARARVAQVRAQFLPSISASASYTRLDEVPYMSAAGFGSMFDPLMAPFEYLVEHGYLDPSTLEGLAGGDASKIYMGDDDIYSVGVSVRQPLFTGGALLNAYGASKHALAAAEHGVRRTADQTRFDVIEAYVGLVQARAARDVMNDAVEQMREHLGNLEVMYEEGMTLKSDIMRARVQMSEIKLERNRVDHGVQLAMAALAFRMGLDPDTTIEPLETLPVADVHSDGLKNLTASALVHRPDLAAMSESVEATGNAVGIARAEFFPQVALVGNYKWDRPNREYEPEFYGHWSATVALQMNVFDWGGRWNRIREAKAARLKAEHGLAIMEDAVRLEVKRSYLQYDEAVTAVVIADEGAAQALESVRVVRENFASGTATNSDVLDAETAKTTSEMNRISAHARLRVAAAQLELATGAVQ